jgi:hypothetical protein
MRIVSARLGTRAEAALFRAHAEGRRR